MKQIIKLKGSLPYRPVVGERMMIFQNGKPKYYTSVVVVIRKNRRHSVEVETKNTVYRITYEKGKNARKAA